MTAPLLRLPSMVICALLLMSGRVIAQVGDVTPVHDPSIIDAAGKLYLFSTGHGIAIRESSDLYNWKRSGRVFDQMPEWTSGYLKGDYVWAPDISCVDGEYRLYYAVSTFGKTHSAIGLTTNSTLDSRSPSYKWLDLGKVVDTPANNDWNAIDPCAFLDEQGNDWLVLGSCWSGIKLLQLNRKTGLLADPSERPIPLAAHPPTNIIEEAYIRRHGAFYYLWVSVDHCCRGIKSDYRILVGRSDRVQGPYLDVDGRPMLKGGGTLVLSSYDHVRGPGSCAIIESAGHDYLVHHEYDAANSGIPTLQIRQMFWTDDGWPVVGQPICHSPCTRPAQPIPVEGDWQIRYDYGSPITIHLSADGMIALPRGSWRLTDNKLTLTWQKAAKPIIEHCFLAEDGGSFAGRTDEGRVISGDYLSPQKGGNSGG